MKILVLGAGQVGKTVAQALSHEHNDVTVIDRDRRTLKALESRLDIKTVLGHAGHPDVLIRAGAEDADLILAVTDITEMMETKPETGSFRPVQCGGCSCWGSWSGFPSAVYQVASKDAGRTWNGGGWS